jgi:hypothetical protein
MPLSMRTDYALRALAMLAENHGQQPVSIPGLARRNDIPKKSSSTSCSTSKEQGWEQHRQERRLIRRRRERHHLDHWRHSCRHSLVSSFGFFPVH